MSSGFSQSSRTSGLHLSTDSASNKTTIFPMSIAAEYLTFKYCLHAASSSCQIGPSRHSTSWKELFGFLLHVYDFSALLIVAAVYVFLSIVTFHGISRVGQIIESCSGHYFGLWFIYFISWGLLSYISHPATLLQRDRTLDCVSSCALICWILHFEVVTAPASFGCRLRDFEHIFQRAGCFPFTPLMFRAYQPLLPILRIGLGCLASLIAWRISFTSFYFRRSFPLLPPIVSI